MLPLNAFLGISPPRILHPVFDEWLFGYAAIVLPTSLLLAYLLYLLTSRAKFKSTDEEIGKRIRKNLKRDGLYLVGHFVFMLALPLLSLYLS